ncbi:hypothetical protein F5882DRAFT_451384 [Hyaloscypha sp. PMI_1271]|nr:hypothetical protein F5882DRAFT_451384 [Hyaloscypha sp. PMI_1271]
MSGAAFSMPKPLQCSQGVDRPVSAAFVCTIWLVKLFKLSQQLLPRIPHKGERAHFGPMRRVRKPLVRSLKHVGFLFVDAQLGPSKKFVIGIDYGTTFTSVSYYAIETEGSEKSARAADIKTVKEWPDAPYEADEQVPTQTWYSPIPMKRAPLNENEQFDAPKSKPSSTQIVEEEYEDGNENEAENRCAGEGLSTPAVEEERSRLNFVERQSADFYWGYSVQMKRYQEWITRDSNLLVQRPKLMLLGTTYTEGDRKTLRSQITRLINQGIIRKYGKRADPDVRDVRDVITDFLIKVFEHTKQYLARKDGYIKGCPVEFVVTVPTIWTQEASRILQFCVEAAIKETELGCLKNGSVDNLFLIPEPEAGLTWLLQITKAMVAGETVINLDAGGGTVDCVAYEIDTCWPLKLGREVVNPGGDNCGSSYLNERLKEHLLVRLRDETYLEDNGLTRQAIVDKLAALDFEPRKKRINIYDQPDGCFCIIGLKSDSSRRLAGESEKRFGMNTVLLDQDDFDDIFSPILQRVWEVLEKQLDSARSKGITINNVFLLGGFAGSPSLITALRMALREYAAKENINQIRLIEDTNKKNAAVSSGAVLRALNKKNGPRRFAQSSYGFLRREPFQPLLFKAHSQTTPKIDKVDGERYVDVINYFMRKSTLISSVYEFPPISAIHTFEIDENGPLLEMKCEELLYVSDTATESHYTLTNRKNKDAQGAGRIVTDVTVLRDEGHLEIIYPEAGRDGVVHTKPHYRVVYDLVVIVEGRNLRYEARWPALDNDVEIKKRKRVGKPKHLVLETAQVSIASAFLPGTG